jgi:hypothetical protein
MTASRALGIGSAITGTISVIAGPLTQFSNEFGVSPKWGALLGLLSLTIATFTERAQGSPDYRRRKAAEKARREEARRE